MFFYRLDFSIPNFGMYVSNFGMCVPNFGMYVSNFGMENFFKENNFFPVGEFFYSVRINDFFLKEK